MLAKAHLCHRNERVITGINAKNNSCPELTRVGFVIRLCQVSCVVLVVDGRRVVVCLQGQVLGGRGVRRDGEDALTVPHKWANGGCRYIFG